jgi:hypothetical protein
MAVGTDMNLVGNTSGLDLFYHSQKMIFIIVTDMKMMPFPLQHTYCRGV